MDALIRFLGLPGSFSWAIKQMRKGKIVRPKHATGTVKYKFDSEGQERIVWSFERSPSDHPADWENANIFASDFANTDWVLWER